MSRMNFALACLALSAMFAPILILIGQLWLGLPTG